MNRIRFIFSPIQFPKITSSCLFVYLLILLFISISCNQKSGVGKLILDGITYEGKFDKDSNMQGLFSLFDVNNRLVAKCNFFNGQRNGITTTYHSNGKIKENINYFMGKKNGIYSVFDSSGNIFYQDSYYFGRRLGHIYFYNSNSEVKEYYFLNFEGETIYYYNYEKPLVRSINPSEYFNMHISHSLQDNDEKLELFIYILNPPKFSFQYKICSKDRNAKDFVPIFVIPRSNIFYQTFLPNFKGNTDYCISLTIFDSIANKKQTVIQPIEIE
jgi:hypothetical protein